MHEANPIISPAARRTGCRCLLLALAILISLVAALAVFFHFTAQAKIIYWLDRNAMKDLQNSIPDYKVEYNRFPILGDIPTSQDLALRSRGPMLPVLIGKNIGGLNPKEIKFFDLHQAEERKSGLWQNGDEWVLSDQWGEPFYIILDTNGDGKIANPEFGAEHPYARSAQSLQQHPLPDMLPVEIVVYSSGPDRDPRTWKDNVCSWRTR